MLAKPFYHEFFEFVHNVGNRGKSLLYSLAVVSVKQDPGNHYEQAQIEIEEGVLSDA